MYVVFAISLIRFLKRRIAISKNKIFIIVQSRPFHYPAYIRNYKKRVSKRHIAISKNKIFIIVQSRPFHYPAYICNL